jgi:hypothetical protein
VLVVLPPPVWVLVGPVLPPAPALPVGLVLVPIVVPEVMPKTALHPAPAIAARK